MKHQKQLCNRLLRHVGKSRPENPRFKLPSIEDLENELDGGL
jgi:hypothetical protein